MTASLRLGPFVLDETVGSGGMGQVWRGHHAGQHQAVAVKVINRPGARANQAQAAFRNEVRAMARLDHPGIVLVFDHGLVDAEAAASSGGELRAGSPYLAMELVSGGTLRDVAKPLRWPALRGVLVSILRALAHAHARGVVHRDLKPANVLMAWSEQGVAQLKLTDFGIAHAFGAAGEGWDPVEPIVGTLPYMAPEQILGRSRDQGPWTDLYAVGCLGFQLATGRLPFYAEQKRELSYQQLTRQPPNISPLVDLPQGFNDWIQRLLAKHPAHRYTSAAAAAHELEALDDGESELPVLGRDALGTGSSEGANTAPEHGLVTRVVPDAILRARLARSIAIDDETEATVSDSDPQQVWTESDIRSAFEMDTDQFMRSLSSTDSLHVSAVTQPIHDGPGQAGPLAGAVSSRIQVPLPDSWRDTEPKARSNALIGAGLGLYGLRPIPLVDREAYRDDLWRTLNEVIQTGRAAAVLLTGSAGNGKSRLVEWLTQLATEVAGVPCLRAVHSPIAGPADGLAPMVSAQLRCLGLSTRRVRQRARRFLATHPLAEDDERSVLALVELMDLLPSLSDQSGRHSESTADLRLRFATPAERYAEIGRLVRRVGSGGPVIMWLDDVQWGADALALSRFLLARQARHPLPLLICLTARSDALHDRPVEAQLIEELAANPNLHPIEVGPLESEDQQTLIEKMLGLEGSLVAEVRKRTHGNPLFAVQLVGDWVQRGVLEVAEEGFALRKGERAELPDDIHQLWQSRLDNLVRPNLRLNARRALELAAALGQEVIEVEWSTVCRLAQVPIPSGMVDAMVGRRLATPGELGWSFTHGMLRESLVRSARRADRWASHHRHCAKMLEDRFGDDVSIAERLAGHLIEGEQKARALEPLLIAAEMRRTQSDFERGHELFERREALLAELGSGEEDPAWVQGWVLRSRAYISQGHLDKAARLIEPACERADKQGWDDELAIALTARGYLSLNQGRTKRSRRSFQQALDVLGSYGNESARADALTGLGNACMFRGELDEAAEFIQAARDIYARQRDLFNLGRNLRVLANVFQCMGDNDRAVVLIQEAVETFETIGNRVDLSLCLNDLGEVHRYSGELEDAERLYRESIQIADRVGYVVTSTPLLNLGFVLIARGEFAAAYSHFERLLDLILGSDHPNDVLWVYAGLLTCAAARRDWDDWDLQILAVRATSERSGYVDEDVAWCAETAGRLAREAGQQERAADAFELAREQWRRLKRTERLAALEAEQSGEIS